LQTLQALKTLIQNDPEQITLLETADRRIAELEALKNVFLIKQVDRANQLLNNQYLSEAKPLVESLHKLYGEEDSVQKLVKRFNTLAQEQ
jgi:hypothetical protein